MTATDLESRLSPLKFARWQCTTRPDAPADAVCCFTAGLRSGGCLAIVAPSWTHVAAALSSGSLVCDEAARVVPGEPRLSPRGLEYYYNYEMLREKYPTFLRCDYDAPPAFVNADFFQERSLTVRIFGRTNADPAAFASDARRFFSDTFVVASGFKRERLTVEESLFESRVIITATDVEMVRKPLPESPPQKRNPFYPEGQG